jgi:uncharacterized membrane protein
MALHLAALAWFARTLPAGARVPMHWNIHNQIDGWTGKTTGLLFGLAMNLGLFLLLYLMPWYSPWYKRYRERFEKLLPRLTAMLVLFFGILSLYSLWIAKYGDVQGVNLIMLLIGLLFIFLGDLLPKVPKNFFIGIRTPWTLSNEVVWERTHRLGGIMFVIGGAIMALKAFVLAGNQPFQVATAVLALALVLYPLPHSFIVYKQLKK